ncbi:MAG: selenoneine biosynthesis selenosugar synthase SenB, partial [Candidatus Binatia bacterium]
TGVTCGRAFGLAPSRPMKIRLITPAGSSARNGNSVTALRWRRILTGLGHRVTLEERYRGGLCDLMVALHALRSFESIRDFHEQHPELPLIVTLTGTDLYRDIHNSPNARRSLEWATRLIVLQSMGMAELPKRLHSKTRVIYQSAPPLNGKIASPPNGFFKVAVVGHLRPEKDPLRTAMASQGLPSSSRIRVFQVGRALTHDLARRARAEAKKNPRYRWLGELPHWKARQVLAGSHLLTLTSRMEGSSNVLCEAISSSVPVIASKIPGLIGTLGENYPGYFPVGDTRELAHLLQRVESDTKFYRRLKERCARLAPLVGPARERKAWQALLKELASKERRER